MGKKKTEQDWRLVKQTLYEIDFTNTGPDEENKFLATLEAKLNNMDVTNRPSLALGKTFYSIANKQSEKKREEDRKKLQRAAFDNNPVIAPTVNTLNKQALFKKRQERQVVALEPHLKGKSVNLANNNKKLPHGCFSNSQMQPWYSNTKKMNPKVVVESRNNSLLEKTNETTSTNKLDNTQPSIKIKPVPKINLSSWEFPISNKDNLNELWCSSPQSKGTININTSNTPSPIKTT